MSRILQIRRGTSAQNDNFTGLAGEITFDTDNKTIRVHDGQKLGGYPIARADDIPNATFDIGTVSDDFWGNLFARFSAATPHIVAGPEMPLNENIAIECVFDCPTNAIYATAKLICCTPDAGFNTGDMVSSFGIGQYFAPQPNITQNGNIVTARIITGGDDFWVRHNDTGVKTAINPQKWTIKFFVWC